jgi:F-type H+-transporting ATPase subunit b
LRLMSRISTAMLFAGLLSAPAIQLHAQAAKDHSPSEQQGKQWRGTEEHMDAPENEQSIEQYRHSSVVQAIARTAHVRIETAAQIFEDFNSAIMIGSILFFLWKVLPKMFGQRSQIIQQELTEARSATEDANRRLAAVEAKLSRLDSEIDAVRQQVEREAQEEEKRIHAAMEMERERIIASAEQEIAAVQSAAQRELKKFAADLAIDHAMRRIQLSTDADRVLISNFGKALSKPGGKA